MISLLAVKVTEFQIHRISITWEWMDYHGTELGMKKRSIMVMERIKLHWLATFCSALLFLFTHGPQMLCLVL